MAGPSFSPSERQQVILELGRNLPLAHAVIFGARHTDATPAFHREIITDWHSHVPNVGTMAFRGAAKSTLAEEALCIEACFGWVQNVLVLGESEQRAVDRLRTIKHIFETNDYLQALFEIGPGDIWTEAKVTLSNGIILQAYGRGQSLRGVKHLDTRPDMIFFDDIVDKESVATPEARAKTMEWFTSTVMPSRGKNARMRMAATPLHPEALAPTLVNAEKSWLFKTYPIMYRDADNAWAPTWPARFPMGAVMKIKADLEEIGRAEDFTQEYMCQARNPATQTFTADMFRVEPTPRSWHAVYAMYDPARTTHKKSATTGKVVWSWVGRKLVIWDASAERWMPDEIVDDIFKVDDEYRPVAIGVEETGLNEFLLQPVRTRQVQKGHTVPLRALHAPKGKLDFIRALQPYFRAGDVVFARELPDLRNQLLGFPSGAIDAPNALAYALKMRAGAPVYDGFNGEHIVEDLEPLTRSPLWLAVNSDGRVTTAALCQLHRGRLSVIADWMAEGDPGTALADIVMEASAETPVTRQTVGKLLSPTLSRTPVRLVAPPRHWDLYGGVGLRQAARKVPADVQRGGEIGQGREELRALFRKPSHGEPSVAVSSAAGWTLRAFSGGFARGLDSAEPEDNSYRVLMEGIECFTAMLRGVGVAVDTNVNYDYTPAGQKFISARAR